MKIGKKKNRLLSIAVNNWEQENEDIEAENVKWLCLNCVPVNGGVDLNTVL